LRGGEGRYSIREVVDFWLRLGESRGIWEYVEEWRRPKPETVYEKIAKDNLRKPLEIPLLRPVHLRRVFEVDIKISREEIEDVCKGFPPKGISEEQFRAISEIVSKKLREEKLEVSDEVKHAITKLLIIIGKKIAEAIG